MSPYQYNSSNQLTSIPNVSYTYDNMDRVTQADIYYTFDTAGTLSVKFGYDKGSNRKTMTDPQNLPTTYGYDVLNRLSSLAFNGQSPAFGFVYEYV